MNAVVPNVVWVGWGSQCQGDMLSGATVEKFRDD